MLLSLSKKDKDNIGIEGDQWPTETYLPHRTHMAIETKKGPIGTWMKNVQNDSEIRLPHTNLLAIDTI